MKMWPMIVTLLAVGVAMNFGIGARSARAQSDNGYVLIVPPPLSSGAHANPPLQPQDMHPPQPDFLPSDACLKCRDTVVYVQTAQQHKKAGQPLESILTSGFLEPCHGLPPECRRDDADERRRIAGLIKDVYAGKDVAIPTTCPCE